METETLSGLEAMEAEYRQEAFRFCLAIRAEARAYPRTEISDDEGNPSIDVRLQVYPDGEFTFHSGDACYDTSHSGFWGAGSVSPDFDEQECMWVARDLVEQALEDAAQSLT